MKSYLWVSLIIGIIDIYLWKWAVHYAINSILCINTLREKYIKIYKNKPNKNVCQCDKNSFKGLLTNFSLAPNKLKEILDEVKKSIQITNLDYDFVINRFNLYYDMKLVIFGINEERNLIVQFPILYNHT